MVGRTNALVRALVSSVNGMTGVVTLNANIAFDTEETYESGTLGAALNGELAIPTADIDSLYGETAEEESQPQEETPEEETEEAPVEEPVEEPEEPSENN